jgi:hypothetical protein
MKFRHCMKYYPIVIDTGEKIQGSQGGKDEKTGFLDLIFYYEVPESKMEEVKRKFEFIKNRTSTSTVTV